MKDLFGKVHKDKPIEINIYADEIQSKKCPYTNDKWIYIGIVVEDLSKPLLEDIISERFCNNFDKNSPYYPKNNRVIHWSEINDADTKNICKRWFEYILNVDKSGKKFYSYILGINDSNLNKNEFDQNDQFNSKYNRFFRSAILYGLKTFFPRKTIIVKKIYHEEGQQQYDEYFPWHCIYKITQKEDNIAFEVARIKFLPKDHKKDEKSNLIQLCDVYGLCQVFSVNLILHPKIDLLSSFFHDSSKSSKVKYFIPVIHSSFISINIDTASLKNESSFGNAPTTLLRLFISLFILSERLVVLILFQCSRGNPLYVNANSTSLSIAFAALSYPISLSLSDTISDSFIPSL